MLSFAEEIMLLLLEDENGRFVFVPEHAVSCALSGAVLMDLALRGRVDTDLNSLVVVDSAPTGDPLLDVTLEHLCKSNQQHDAKYWVEYCQRDAAEIRQRALDRLCEKGILEQKEDCFLWVFKSRRYPMHDGHAEREVKLRIMSILFSDEIPDPRDIAIIGLADACGIFGHLLSQREHRLARDRIDQVRRMDLIGQAVTACIREIEIQLTQAMAATRM